MSRIDLPPMGDIVNRIRSEFFEMPGLRLTRAQAQRLWGLDERTTRQVLEELLELHFLQQTADGMFRRATDGRSPASRPRVA
jgi:Fic family protein